MFFKELLISVIFALLSFFGFFYFLDRAKPSFPPETLGESSSAGGEGPEKDSVFKEALEPIYTEPLRIHSASINLDVPIVEVGLEADGTLSSPEGWNDAGWYKEGVRPGEPGNLIIDGHYDDSYGRPAAFGGLKNLKTGDKVYVVDKFGRTYSYEVTEVFYLDISDSNRLQVFENDKSKVTLTMITCGGVWVPGMSTYNKRLIVKAELV